jgi:7-cyano-7-deazaguanine synthase in queuosine biosynthesis
MNRDFEVICGQGPASTASREVLNLNLWGASEEDNITLRIEDIHQPLIQDIPSQFHDLVEIAAYVYCADQVIRRAHQDVDSFGGSWRRNFTFKIPVREPDLWNSADVHAALTEVLSFLSDDTYQFTFSKAVGTPDFQRYLGFDQKAMNQQPPEQVIMFSGGLDSLAGAIQEAVVERRRVALVTHKPTAKNNAILRNLYGAIASKTDDGLEPMRLGVRVHKKLISAKEYTQRTRSFLFASVGVTVSKMLGLDSLRFYENGVVSLNLPVCAQVVGSRATRTTHPRVIAGFSKLFSLLGERPFDVSNPFLWNTKAEVIKKIVDAGLPETIKNSVSCAHTWERRAEVTHCGTCSQCIDRRIGIIAAGAEAYDPSSQYKTDIILGSRPTDDDKILSAAFLERANEMEQIEDIAGFISKYPTVLRAIEHIPGNKQGAAQRLFDLYKRHATEVRRAVETLFSRHSKDIFNRTLPGDSLLRIVYESNSVESLPAINSNVSPPNYFWNRGNVYEARFRGDEPVMIQKHRKGCLYLQYLLDKPGESFSVFDVAAEFDIGFCEDLSTGNYDAAELNSGFEFSTGKRLSDLGETVDQRAIKEYGERLQDLLEEKREAEDNHDAGRIDAIEIEITAISDQISSAVGKGGARKFKDQRKNLRDAVRNSIDRAITEIGLHDPVFGAHLKNYILKGQYLAYQPVPAISWSVREGRHKSPSKT